MKKKSKTKKIMKLALLGAGAAAAATTGVFFQRLVCRKKSGREQWWDDAAEGCEKYRDQIAEGKEWLKEIEPQSEYWMLQSHDGLMLDARYIPAEPESRKTVICVHGYTSTGKEAYAVMARYLHEEGYNVLLPDNRAHGSSEGKYVGFGCLEREDCYRWIRYVHDKFHGDCEIFLHGTSLGGAAVLMTSELNLPPSVKGIVTDSAYTSPKEQLEEIVKRIEKIGRFSKALVACLNVACKAVAHYSLSDCSCPEAVSRTKIPVFVIHGDADNTVPVSMAKEIYKSCVSVKKLWIVKGAGHAESFYCAQDEYKKRMTEFFEECLGE